MDAARFLQLLRQETPPTDEDLRQVEDLLHRYPYNPHCYLLKAWAAAQNKQASLKESLQAASVRALDRNALRRFVEAERDEQLLEAGHRPKQEYLGRTAATPSSAAESKAPQTAPPPESSPSPAKKPGATEAGTNPEEPQELIRRTRENLSQISQELRENLQQFRQSRVRGPQVDVEALRRRLHQPASDQTQTPSEPEEQAPKTANWGHAAESQDQAEPQENQPTRSSATRLLRDEALYDELKSNLEEWNNNKRQFLIGEEDSVYFRQSKPIQKKKVPGLPQGQPGQGPARPTTTQTTARRASPEEQRQIIDRFIEQGPPESIRPDPATEEGPQQDLSEPFSQLEQQPATETLAKIYAGQGKTEKAAAIYRQLILKNPEKKRYFTDQLKKLESS